MNGTDLFIVEYQGQPYTPMKPIVEGMGLDWKGQYNRLVGRDGHNDHTPSRWGIVKITIPTLGDLQEMICMPLRKLAGWLMTIQPSRVKPQIRDTILQYQNECDDVLWQYWTEGQAIRPHNPEETLLPSEQQTLSEIVHKRVEGYGELQGKVLAEIWSLVHHKFWVAKYNQLPRTQLAKAILYVTSMEIRVAGYQFDENFITTKQRQELEQAVTRALRLVEHDCGDSGRQWTHNRLCIMLSIRCMEEMHVKQFPLALAELEQLESVYKR